jgi:hypothetical protein
LSDGQDHKGRIHKTSILGKFAALRVPKLCSCRRARKRECAQVLDVADRGITKMPFVLAAKVRGEKQEGTYLNIGQMRLRLNKNRWWHDWPDWRLADDRIT